MHYVCTPTGSKYIHIGAHKSVVNSFEDGIRVSKKYKPSFLKEKPVYDDLRTAGNFVLRHKFYNDHVTRYDVSPTSLADIILLVEEGKYIEIDKSIREYTRYYLPEFPHHNFNLKIEHGNCSACRLYLFHLGRVFNTIFKRCTSFVKVAMKKYAFVLTPDNVDLNGILDFEDYKAGETMPFIQIMAPFMDAFFRLYNHVGCYFITAPAYSQPTIRAYFNDVPAPENLCRISYSEFIKFYHIEEYIGFRPTADISGFFKGIDFTLPYKIHNAHLWPVNGNTYVPLPFNKPTTLTHCYVEYSDLDKLRSQINDVSHEMVYILIKNHPSTPVYFKRMFQYICNIFVNSLYDSNVPFWCFEGYGESVRMPIVGTMSNTDKCECFTNPTSEEEYTKCDMVLKSTVNHLMPLTNRVELSKFNPILADPSVDTRLVKLADIPNTSVLYREPDYSKFKVYDDHELIDYYLSRGLHLVPAGHDPPSGVSTDKIYDTSYKFFIPTPENVQDDLKLYNLYTDSSFSLTTMLVAYKNLLDQYFDIVKADPDIVTVQRPEDIEIKNKKKSSGFPNNIAGDADLHRTHYGNDFLFRLVKHAKHSVMKSFTSIQNKFALSVKARSRTVSCNSFNITTLGRSLYRPLLNKVKSGIDKNCPVLIGLNIHKGGWDKVIRSIDIERNTGADVKVSSLDFPKFDRKSGNSTQLMSRSIAFFMHDPIANKAEHEIDVCDLHHMFLAEQLNVIFDTIHFGNSIYQKTNGITSGSASTADSNSASHLLLAGYAYIDQIVRATDKNVDIQRQLRDQVSELVFMTPAALIDTLSNPIADLVKPILSKVRREIFYIRVLSDDGLTAFDARIIDFEAVAKQLYMLSKYDVGNDKFTVHTPEQGPHEFLSQHTEIINGKFHPRPVFERIFTSLIQFSKDTNYSETIRGPRLVALYTLMYVYKIVKGFPKEAVFVDVLRDYIRLNFDTIDFSYLKGSQHPDVSFQTSSDIVDIKDLDDFVCKNTGLPPSPDYSTTNNNIDVISSEAATVTKPATTTSGEVATSEAGDLLKDSVSVNPEAVSFLCFICDNKTLLHCSCGFYLCNGPAQSHIAQHLATSTCRSISYGGTVIKCSVNCCNIRDVHLLNVFQGRIMCNQHVTSDRLRCGLVKNGHLQVYQSSDSVIRADHLRRALEVIECIRTKRYPRAIIYAMDLFDEGCPRPYIYLNYYLTELTGKQIQSTQLKHEISNLSYQPGIGYSVEITNFEHTKTYDYYAIADDGATTKIDPIGDYTKGNDSTLITFDCSFRPVAIHSRPIDYHTAYINKGYEFISPKLYRFINYTGYMGDSSHSEDPLAELCSRASTRDFTFVLGPPGTGKSTLIGKFVKQLVGKVAVLAPSHQAVDVITAKIRSEGCEISRVAAPDESRSSKVIPNYRTKALLVSGTLRSFALSGAAFKPDYVIIDEVSMASDNDLLTILNNAVFNSSHFIFCGDPYQLSSVDDYRMTDKYKYSNIICMKLAIEKIPIYLSKHYRCTKVICDFISKQFYKGRLECQSNVAPLSTSFGTGLVFVSCNNRNIVNTADYDTIKLFLTENYASNSECSFAVYTAYRAQLSYLSAKIHENPLWSNVRVNTIDSGQGDEADIVIISLSKDADFTRDNHRLNVAISRARKFCLVILPCGIERYEVFKDCTITNISNIHPEPFSLEDVNGEISPESRPIDLRCLSRPAHITDAYSPFWEDFFFFDAEFGNLFKDRSVAALMSYAIVNHKGEAFESCGKPQIATQHGYKNILPTRQNFIVPKNTSSESSKKYAELITMQLNRCEKRQQHDTNILDLVPYLYKHTLAAPTFVTYSGHNDFPYISEFCKSDSDCSVKGCSFLPVAIVETKTGSTRPLCGVHSINESVVSLVNCRFLDVIFDQDGNIHFNKKVTRPIKLVDAHKVRCTEEHGDAHDPRADAMMLSCIFKKHNDEVCAYLKDRTSLSRYSNRHRSYVKRHDILSYYLSSLNKKICDRGCGYRPIPGACKVDILFGNDMNNHQCNSDIDVYIDSIYYKRGATEKESYIFYDPKRAHISETVFGQYFYNKAKCFTYKMQTLVNISGVDVFREMIGPCRGPSTTKVLPLSHYDFLSNSLACIKRADCDNLTICEAHNSNLYNILKIAKMHKFGYQFIRVPAGTTINRTSLASTPISGESYNYTAQVYNSLCDYIDRFEFVKPKISVITCKTHPVKLSNIHHTLSERKMCYEILKPGDTPVIQYPDIVYIELNKETPPEEVLGLLTYSKLPYLLIIRHIGPAPDLSAVYQYSSEVELVKHLPTTGYHAYSDVFTLPRFLCG